MADKPIIMSAPMVQALLRGDKTQTRRVIKPQPDKEVTALKPRTTYAGNTLWSNVLWETRKYGRLIEIDDRKAPYQVGDMLWVKETWLENAHGKYLHKADWARGGDEEGYECNGWGWKSPMFMPRVASRITLEVTDVRAQQVQEISETDAMAEGEIFGCDSVEWFRDLWDSINAKRGYGWETNPWVWVIEFATAQK